MTDPKSLSRFGSLFAEFGVPTAVTVWKPRRQHSQRGLHGSVAAAAAAKRAAFASMGLITFADASSVEEAVECGVQVMVAGGGAGRRTHSIPQEEPRIHSIEVRQAALPSPAFSITPRVLWQQHFSGSAKS
eukprot:SAG31_NODE_6368_length_2041_cov_11.623069_1_plen_131_part_00